MQPKQPPASLAVLEIYRVQLIDGSVQEVQAAEYEHVDGFTVFYVFEPKNIDPIAPNARKVEIKSLPTVDVVSVTSIRSVQ